MVKKNCQKIAGRFETRETKKITQHNNKMGALRQAFMISASALATLLDLPRMVPVRLTKQHYTKDLLAALKTSGSTREYVCLPAWLNTIPVHRRAL